MTFEQHVANLRKHFPNPPDYETFKEMWSSWDANTRWFVARHISPDDTDPHLRAVAGYLKRMKQEAR